MANKEAIVEETDRRVYRHKRRVRNQVICYIVLALVMIGLIVGSIIGIRKIMSVISDKKHAQELQKQLEELSKQEEEAQPVVEGPAEVSEPPQETATNYLDEIVNSCISEMPLEDKVAGLFIITPEALTGTDIVVRAGDTTREKLGEHAVGGLVYFSQNIKDSAQLTEMLQNTQSWRKYPVFLAVDEEGGKVSRVAESGLADNVGSMGDIGSGGDAAAAREAGAAIGNYLSGYGFNLDFAPVADVIAEGNTTIGDRSFGGDPNLVAPMVSAMIEGIQSTKVSACMKHFPGIGDTTEDSHDGMAVTQKTLEEFSATDFPVYQAGIEAGVDLIMVSHISVPNVTGDNTPSSLSGQMVNDILRGQRGYQGIVVTDARSEEHTSELQSQR